jgi:hypothetical protein
MEEIKELQNVIKKAVNDINDKRVLNRLIAIIENAPVVEDAVM